MSKSVLVARACVLALVALASLTGCGDSPMTPDPVGAAQESTAAMFAQILDKLESIEDRIDSLEATVDATGGGELVLTGLPAAQLDSIIALTSFIGHEMTSGGLEACASIGLAGDFGTEWIGEAEGEGAGHLGAWAGTGAYAGGKITAKAEVGVAIKIEGAGGVEYCHPLFASTPPARPSPAGPLRSAEVDQLGSTLDGITSQFNLTPATLSESLGGIGSAISSPGSISLQTLGSVVPLPPAMASLATNPLGTLSGHISGLATGVQSALCSGGDWGANLSNVVQQACGLIDTGGLANFTVMADIANTFPALQTAVGNVCSRVNGIGLQRLVISSWDLTILGTTYNVFPGYNQRLFPNYTNVACP